MDYKYIDNAQADALLAGLLERYSPSTQEQPAVEYLVEQMDLLGFRASVDDAGNAVGELGPQEGHEQTILLLGHIDTVPGFIEVRQEDYLLHGRGAVDAKGPLAAFVAAACRADVRSGKHIVVVGAVEEEWATSKGARFLLDRLQPHTALAPHAVVIGEPSGWDCLTVGYKGRLLVDYALAREMGHTAGPERGPCEEAVAFWQQVVEHVREHNARRNKFRAPDAPERLFEQLTPSLRQICSGDNGFTEKVSMTICFRLPLDADVEELEKALISFSGDAELRFRGHEVAFRADKNTPLVRAFLKAIRAEGGTPRFQVKSGTSDMNVVGPVWNCPILAYGPGDSTLDHTPQEHVDLREYHQAIAVLTRVLAEL